MKKLLLTFFTLIFFFLESCNSNENNKINTNKIKLIKVGLSEATVISILGNPLQVENKYKSMGKTFTYTRVPKYAMTYPMLWVHFDKNENVNQVFAKKYILWGADDECIYIQDSTINNKNFNQEALKKMFK